MSLIFSNRFWFVQTSFVLWSKFNSLQNSMWITLLNMQYLILDSFYTILQHLLRKGLIISYFSLYKVPLLFYGLLSIFASTKLVLTALFSVLIRKDSFSLFWFLFFSSVNVFLCTIFPHYIFHVFVGLFYLYLYCSISLVVFTQVRKAVNLVRSQELFWLFILIITRPYSGWSPLFLWSSLLAVFFSRHLETVPEMQTSIGFNVTLTAFSALW